MLWSFRKRIRWSKDQETLTMKTVLYLASIAVVFSLSFQSACAQDPPASPSVGPVAGQPWTSSLGVKFVPAGTDGVLFSVWDVRVKDFKAFVDATGYDATKGMVSLDNDGTDGWKARGDTWKSPGFAQTDDDPVVGVNLNDAKAFCDWLTKKEQAEGKLGANQLYRVPYDAEWSKAVGLNESSEGTPQSKGLSKDFEMVYPWGKGWPPPKGAGNYAGSEAKDAKWFSRAPTIKGYDDGYPRTSPVGSFPANAYGLYDMGGNVWQWCDDKYTNRGAYSYDCMVQRGGSWMNYNSDYLLSIYRNYVSTGIRTSCFGMRVVVVVSPPIAAPPVAAPPVAAPPSVRVP
jgi:formylglycine-generating enzyme required for sulfatase activity